MVVTEGFVEGLQSFARGRRADRQERRINEQQARNNVIEDENRQLALQDRERNIKRQSEEDIRKARNFELDEQLKRTQLEQQKEINPLRRKKAELEIQGAENRVQMQELELGEKRASEKLDLGRKKAELEMFVKQLNSARNDDLLILGSSLKGEEDLESFRNLFERASGQQVIPGSIQRRPNGNIVFDIPQGREIVAGELVRNAPVANFVKTTSGLFPVDGEGTMAFLDSSKIGSENPITVVSKEQAENIIKTTDKKRKEVLGVMNNDKSIKKGVDEVETFSGTRWGQAMKETVENIVNTYPSMALIGSNEIANTAIDFAKGRDPIDEIPNEDREEIVNDYRNQVSAQLISQITGTDVTPDDVVEFSKLRSQILNPQAQREREESQQVINNFTDKIVNPNSSSGSNGSFLQEELAPLGLEVGKTLGDITFDNPLGRIGSEVSSATNQAIRNFNTISEDVTKLLTGQVTLKQALAGEGVSPFISDLLGTRKKPPAPFDRKAINEFKAFLKKSSKSKSDKK